MTTAFIHNPNSLRNRNDGERLFSKAKAIFGELCVYSHHDEQLLDDIKFLYNRGVSTIGINGGDGSVSSCLTAIAAVYPKDALPDIAVIPSGNTNLIASDVGFGRRDSEAMEKLAKPQTLSHHRRSPIRLSWPGDKNRPAVLGMFGGCAGYARAVRIAHSPTVLKFAPHDLAVFLTIISSIASLFMKKTRHQWLNGDRLSWTAKTVNGAVQKRERSFLFLTTGLEKISHKIWPFWDCENAGKGLHFLDVDSFPKDLPRAIFNLLRGKAPLWIREHPDYASYRAQSINIVTDSDFVLDGEVFSPAPDSRLLLEQGPSFRFLHD
ncbi:acylglycerol kinase family protein [Acetobacteraceae bacterium ESL0697]|nr:acylglycerol kinase family protein [Acetobacteraceae bacterium ESL0697]